ncbi:Hypothetical predicted protein [Cloeon dipterum]|uniref:Caspase family p20 domain-containing protein n=1 Tax=Cloeon dipterum TaxID=197152 RepID=A0A8S1DK39_9INSE|nr:Hypothetical predicted protein [Cloeon dipterum]
MLVDHKKCIGYWDEDKSKLVRTTCVLMIHYSYLDIENREITKHVKESMANLRDTLGHHVHFYDTSAKYQEICEILSHEHNIRKKFGLKDNALPDLFIIFIITHGNIERTLGTDHGEKFHVSHLKSILSQSPALSNALKLLYIAACRGLIVDELVQGRFNPIPRKNRIMSRNIDVKGQNNLNAVRVTVDEYPIHENCVTIFECVETTSALVRNGSNLVNAFCATFRTLEKDIGLDEFLTRCMCQHHYTETQRYGYGPTPEIKVLKHRPLTISKQFFESPTSWRLRPKIIAPLSGTQKPIQYDYDWKSDQDIALLTRKAHLYIASKSKDSVHARTLGQSLKNVFGFEIKNHDGLAQLQNSVSSEKENHAGCILVCIVAPLFYCGDDRELCVYIGGVSSPIKNIQYSAIGPKTEQWIGKPKIFIFLHATHATERKSDRFIQQDSPSYQNTAFTRASTLHAGLLSLILPQRDSLELFVETLKEFTKPDKLTQRTGETSQDFSLNELERRLNSAKIAEDSGRGEKNVSKYWVTVVSAETGSGKTALVEILAERAQREQRSVTLVYLRNNIRGELQPFGNDEFLILDGFDSLQPGYYQRSMLRMIEALARDKIDFVVTTRPEFEDALKECLEKICPVNVVTINKLSEESQIIFLHQNLGMSKVEIKKILAKIREAHAEDLIEKVGNLAKVADFLHLNGHKIDDFYLLSKHVFEETMASVLRSTGETPGSRRYRDLYSKQVEILTKRAYDFYLGRNGQQEHDFGFETFLVSVDTFILFICVEYRAQ